MKRVAAYCRVSTDKTDQIGSFESQKRYFREYIEQNADLELYRIYADEGITGTNVKNRVSFKNMIEDAKNGKFDLILTKEISRFARNLLDSIYYTRELKRYGVSVFFINDRIDTMEPDAELRLAILATIAQEESRRTSERVKWGQTRRMEAGIVFGRSMLGYDVKNGEMTVNEEGAEIVRAIFRMYTEDKMGFAAIARALDENGIPPMRAQKWNGTVVMRILKNEIYVGDLLQKKTYTPDYLSHEKKYNRGAEEMIVIRDHHTPIIPREVFEKAAMMLSGQMRKTD
jgi:DNA invertase Pin-like site-specific DNA recombinase